MNAKRLLQEDKIVVDFKGERFSVIEWVPGETFPFSHCQAIAFDTETEALVSGAFPTPVLLQVAAYNHPEVIFVAPEYFDQALNEIHNNNPNAFWVFFNAPFDTKVLGWPKDPLWKVFTTRKFVDLEIRGALSKLADGTYIGPISLDSITYEKLEYKLEKNENLRLSFKRDTRLTPAQIRYAAQDVIATIKLWDFFKEPFESEDINIKGAFALQAISDLGIRLDENERARLDQYLLGEQLRHRNILKLFGIAPAMPGLDNDVKVHGVNKRKQMLLEALEAQYGVKFKRTDKANTIVTEKKTLDLQLIVYNIPKPTWLVSLRRFEYVRHLRTTYLSPNMVGVDGRVHAHFIPLVRTGRTACSKPPLQQYPRDPLKTENGEEIGEIRGIWVPTEGYLFLASDYCQLELCVLAQSCYKRFGKSTLLDLINSGIDVHMWFGAQLGKKKNLQFNPDDKNDPVMKELRQRAKAANFGIPGGLGPATLVAYAQSFGLSLTMDDAKELIEFWLECLPEMKNHFEHSIDEVNTLKNIRRFIRDNDIKTTFPVNDIWTLKTVLLQQGIPAEEVNKQVKNLVVYKVKTITGRIKRNCTYCSAANLEFQGPASDGAKLALWEGYVRGWRIVNFIHDEILQEVSAALPLEERTRQIKEIENVLITAMKKVCPDVNIRVESALMTKWLKAAKPVYDADGNLLVWMPTKENPAEDLKKI